jgi:hypothetical protein
MTISLYKRKSRNYICFIALDIPYEISEIKNNNGELYLALLFREMYLHTAEQTTLSRLVLRRGPYLVKDTYVIYPPQSLQANVGDMSSNKPQPLPLKISVLITALIAYKLDDSGFEFLQNKRFLPLTPFPH